MGDKTFTTADIVEMSSPTYVYGIELPSGKLVWDAFEANGLFNSLPFGDLKSAATRGRAQDIYMTHLTEIGAWRPDQVLGFVRRAKTIAFTAIEDVTDAS